MSKLNLKVIIIVLSSAVSEGLVGSSDRRKSSPASTAFTLNKATSIRNDTLGCVAMVKALNSGSYCS